jgi:hypothetical protein
MLRGEMHDILSEGEKRVIFCEYGYGVWRSKLGRVNFRKSLAGHLTFTLVSGRFRGYGLYA